MQHHYKHAHKIFRIKKEIGEIFLNLVILTFAISLIGVFVPLYLLDIGFALPMVFIFYIIQELSWVFFSPVTVRIGSRFGVKYTMAIAVSLLSIFFSLLHFFAQFHPSFLFATAILGGIAFNLYWSPLNTEFVKNLDKIYETQEIGESFAFPQIAVMFAPLIGGVILTVLGFNILFSFAISLMVFSLIPFFLLEDYKPQTFKKHRRSRLWKNKRIVADMVIKGTFQVSSGLMWPLYIFFTTSDIITIGIAITMQGFAITFFTLFGGFIGKKVKRNKLFKFAAIIYAIAWFTRGFTVTPLEIYILSFLSGAAWALFAIPVFASFSDIARKENILMDAATRESILHIGKFIPILIIFLLPITITHIFILIGFLSLIAMLLGCNVKK